MCGRFTRQYTWEQLHALYSLSPGGSNLQPRYNIVPTTTIDFAIERRRHGMEPYLDRFDRRIVKAISEEEPELKPKPARPVAAE